MQSGIVVLLVGAFLFVTGFSSRQVAYQRRENQLVGEWRNVYVHIEVRSDGRTAIVDADSTNWEVKLKMKPIRTHFLPDGTYYSEYFTLKDSIFRKTTGKWQLKKDSLYTDQLTPEKASYKYSISLSNGHLLLKGLIDFNEDGKADDTYTGIQKKSGPK